MRLREIFEDGRIVKGVNTTVDVGTDEIKKQAAKFGNTVDKDGVPPTLSKQVKGKSTNVLFNLGLSEGYKLKLERDKELLVLNITDTATGKRTEVRGKAGYESGGYDAKDKLHQLLDRVGKSANISELINGEVVTINPKHPDGAKAKAATDAAYNESNLFTEALGELDPSTEIYVDMDGVLADFFGEWSKLMGVNNWKEIKDIPNALAKIRATDDFWLNLPVLPEAKQLLSLIKQVKGEYNICTSPLADDPNSEPHKRKWIEKNLAFFPPKNIHITHNKPQYATNSNGTPNILIDDFGKNINAWEAAGGIGFKYKDHKFERTAKAIKQHMQEPVEENFADGKNNKDENFNKSISTIDLKNALEKIAKNATNGERLVDVFMMRYKHDMTFKQIGAEIGTGIDRARQVYLRAERMVRKSLQDYDPNSQTDENFADGKKKVQEAFDNPYPINWTNLQDAGGSNAKVKLDDGGILDISITEADYGYYEIEFSKGGTLKPTGEGDEFRIFATVIAAIKQWWKQLDKEEVMEIHFSAAVADGGRSKLYKRFANQWAQLIGWSMDFDEDPKTISFVLNNPQFESVAENFATDKIKKNTINYKNPNFDFEWNEAERYPEFAKIGKAAWIELAKTGKAVTIKSAKGINNTDAADPDSFKSLDAVKQGRALDQLKSGTVEMPIIAVYSDGWKELIGGNTRLTAMLAQDGKATVWVFKVPDEVAELAENFADGKKPGRKGLAKRSGVNTKASVSSLRKTAKRSSGEKQRMAHWQANMKAGKAKKK